MNRPDHKKIVAVAIIETVIFGASAFQAKCTGCDWKGPHRNTEKHADSDATRHGKSVIAKAAA